MLFFSYFKELVGKEVTVELKNDLAIRGMLHSVDQYLNIKLENTRVVDQDKYPHMPNCIDVLLTGRRFTLILTARTQCLGNSMVFIVHEYRTKPRIYP
ncbi:unnamed protein product [Miscanthus lutarioriparius]|uniref:Sm domain-containing protein n=1 Tax=Miscanthus lutarioriparius TaxID=422564 RepID=A0A811R7T0_9POAL|nr:unnamed protein product [Miscanthus lutarioriparius]